MKRFHQVIAVFFAIFILTFVGFFIALPEKNYSVAEKRNLNHMPSLSVSSIVDGSFMSGMEDYICDQFPLRDTFMRAKMKMMTYVGSKESHGVYQMQNDALAERFDKPDAKNKEETIEAIRAFSGRYPGKEMSLLIIPNAISMYPENRPFMAITENQNDYIDEYYRSLNTMVHTIDVRPTFQKERKNQYLYYRTDHHFTSAAAKLTYDQLKEELNLSEEISYVPSTIENQFYGSLTSESGFDVEVPDTIEIYLEEGEKTIYTVTYVEDARTVATCFDTEALKGDNPYEVFFGGNHPLMVIESTSESKRNLLLIKDSYANEVLPFLIPHFEKITVVDPRYYYDDIDVLMQSNDFTDILFLYNVNTLSKDTVLKTVLKNEQ